MIHSTGPPQNSTKMLPQQAPLNIKPDWNFHNKLVAVKSHTITKRLSKINTFSSAHIADGDIKIFNTN
jgi:hypothetical protein